MKSPASFSLLSLFLITTIVALLFINYTTRTKLQSELKTAKAELTDLRSEVGFFEIADPNLVHFRNRTNFATSSYGFQIYTPMRKRFTLNVGEGVLDPDTGLPPIIASGAVHGRGRQLIVAFDPREPNPKTNISLYVQSPIPTGTDDDIPSRLKWVDRDFPHYIDSIRHRNPVHTANADAQVILLKFSENDTFDRAVAPPVGGYPKNPRSFMIWLEPRSL